MTGWQTLLYKETLRFWKVAFQTVAGPVLTAMLYLLVFGQALEAHVKVYDKVSYTAFLVPGLAMMSLLQNAFANSSSSLIMSKVMGNLVFLMLAFCRMARRVVSRTDETNFPQMIGRSYSRTAHTIRGS